MRHFSFDLILRIRSKKNINKLNLLSFFKYIYLKLNIKRPIQIITITNTTPKRTTMQMMHILFFMFRRIMGEKYLKKSYV